MRPAILALFLSTGAMTFCQSAVKAPGSPDNPGKVPPIQNWAGTDFSKISPRWPATNFMPHDSIEPHMAEPARRMSNAQIDPKMIVHPPQSSPGAQQQGTLIARNEFPGLQFLPIGSSHLRSPVIQTQWPHLKIHSIPVEWPKYKLLPIGSQAPITTPAPLK